mmetsp:Transcript_30320/g.88135  ORF Transcript_30320/g.88135 Transcript_30320/m.88135 type:complete len:98 (+) Transcript_30320:26-319(+)
MRVFVFRADNYTGEIAETDEMRPQWWSLSECPFDNMWPDDRYWFPYMWGRRPFVGSFHFKADEKTIVTHTIEATTVEHIDTRAREEADRKRAATANS